MNNISSNRIILPIVMVGGLVVALLMGRWVASGNLVMPGLIIGSMLGGLFVLTLGKMYWYMIPFALASQLPAIPLGGRNIELSEVTIMACGAIFLGRVALKQESLVLFRPLFTPILLSIAWVAMVFMLNPTGFLFLGSSSMGGRFYLKIALAAISFFVMVSQQPENKDFERIIRLVFVGVVLKTIYQFLHLTLIGGFGGEEAVAVVDSEGGYTWHQILSGPAMLGTYWLFARYKPSQILGFQRPWTMVLYIAAIIIAMLSGKRMGLLLVLLTPVLSSILYRQYRYIFVGALFGIITSTVVVIGQGNLFNLPFTAQRALSWLPASWDSRLTEMGSTDTFREELRRIAMEDINKSPWIGKGYALELSEVVTGYNMLDQGGNLYERVIGHAISKSWHNRWLGYSADFGIPFAILLAFILLVVVNQSFYLARKIERPSGSQTFAAFSFFWIMQVVISSHTGGHTALDAIDNWWLYGLLFALAAQTQNQERETAAEKPAELTHNPTSQRERIEATNVES